MAMDPVLPSRDLAHMKEVTDVPSTPRPLTATPSTTLRMNMSNFTNMTKLPPVTTPTSYQPWPKATPVPTDAEETEAPTPATSRVPTAFPVPDSSPGPTPAGVELNSSASSHTIAVTIIAFLGGAIALVSVFCIWQRFLRRGKREDDDATSPPALYIRHPSNAPTAASSAASMHNDGINWHNLHRIQVAVGAIQRTKPLASGAFGTIWLGTYMNKTVAVKTCSKSTRTDIQTFLDELDLMSSLQCPFIVALLAAAWTKATDVHAALEYMPMGDLRDFLTRSKGLSTPPWAEKIAIAIHVVKALVYLKANGIIHRDLKSRNVLLDETTGAKLADFGISRRATDASMSCGVGTYLWIAPEVLAFRHYTVAVDVFSFGVLLTELDTHELPYWDVVQDKRSSSNASIVWRVLHENLRPTFTAQCPQWIVDLATACMHFDPARRPVPEQILGLLETRQCGEAP